MRALRLLQAYLLDPKAQFVGISVSVNVIFLLRSYITMLVLDYGELGLVALIQSLIILIGMLHVGFINGGYRLLCSADEDDAQAINDLVYSAFLVLAVMVSVAGAACFVFFHDSAYRTAALVGGAGGLFTLVRTWLMNQLIARDRLTLYNRFNLYGAAISMAMFLFIPISPLFASLAAVFMQPFAFVILAVTSGATYMPKRFALRGDLAGRVLRAGFVLFLTAVFLQINLQIERWYVVSTLGMDALGHLYLTILFLNLFQLVPTAINAAFLPSLVRSHEADDQHSTRRELAGLFRSTALYCAAMVLAVALLAKPAIAFILPRYLGDIEYVYILLPGLIVFTIASALAVVFNVLIEYRYYVLGYGLGTASLAGAFMAAILAGHRLGLTEVVALRSASYVLMGIALTVGYLRMAKMLSGLRFSRGWLGLPS